MEIKEATPGDWKGLRTLYLALLESDPEAFADQYDEAASRTEEEWKKGFQGNGKVFVAIDEDWMIGMGRVDVYDLPGTAVLHKLGVLPRYRGSGIARKLVEERERWAVSVGARKARLYVIADREKTIEFSRKNGYRVVEAQKNGLQRRNGAQVDIVVMEKDLPR